MLLSHMVDYNKYTPLLKITENKNNHVDSKNIYKKSFGVGSLHLYIVTTLD